MFSLSPDFQKLRKVFIALICIHTSGVVTWRPVSYTHLDVYKRQVLNYSTKKFNVRLLPTHSLTTSFATASREGCLMYLWQQRLIPRLRCSSEVSSSAHPQKFRVVLVCPTMSLDGVVCCHAEADSSCEDVLAHLHGRPGLDNTTAQLA